MQFVGALILIVLFYVAAVFAMLITSLSLFEALAALAIGGLSMLAADFYMTKEGR